MINVLLVDDHQVVLDGLKQLLSNVPDIKVIDTASNGAELFKKLKIRDKVDVILMDVNMPIMDGLEATKEVKKNYPSIKVLMLTMRSEQKIFNQAKEMGADGYLTKNKGKSDFIEAIKLVYEGKEFVRMADLDAEAISCTNPSQHFSDLNQRELQIICLITKQFTSKEITQELSISRLALEVSKKTILKKLGVRNDAGIAIMATKHGLCK